MARLEAVAAGLYYPTPEPLVDALAHMLRIEAVTTHYASSVRILDPCIGTGRAVALLAECLCAHASRPARLMRPGEAEVATSAPNSPSHQDPLRVELYGVELNRIRAQEAAAQCSGGVLVASFFTTTIAEASFSLAFVNPPYDDDYASGGTGGSGRRVRLEIQFLKRATHKLLPDGILVWIVPQARLAEAAPYLASYYDRLACWRFPDESWKAPDAPASAEPLPMYAAFQQVVLLGRRRFTPVPPDSELVGAIENWTRQGDALPILPGIGRDLTPADGADPAWSQAPYTIPFARGQVPIFEAWAYDPDATARQVSLPGSGVWHQSTYRELRWPHLDTTDLGIGRPPMPLREGHLSLLVASGVANGLVVVGKRGWRALVKGGSVKERVRTTAVDDDGTRRDIETERFVNEVYLISLETGELIHVISGTESQGHASAPSQPGQRQDPESLVTMGTGGTVASTNGARPSVAVGVPAGGATATHAGGSIAPAPLVFTQRTMTMAEFLGEFGPSLMTQVAEAAPPLYLGPEDAPFAPLALLKRRPVGAQGLIAQAKACAIRGLRSAGSEPGWKRVPRLGNVGEMSTGKVRRIGGRD